MAEKKVVRMAARTGLQQVAEKVVMMSVQSVDKMVD